MKTIFFQGEGATRSKQVLMQSACFRGHRHVHREDRAQTGDCSRNAVPNGVLRISAAQDGRKCGIFAKADPMPAGVPVEEIIASLFGGRVPESGDADAGQRAYLRSCAGGPNLFFKGLRSVAASLGKGVQSCAVGCATSSSLIRVPDNALYAALGCVEVALRKRAAAKGSSTGSRVEEKKKIGRGGLCKDGADLPVKEKYEKSKAAPVSPQCGTGSV